MQAFALALGVSAIVLIRGGLKGLNPVESFQDIFSRIPALGGSAQTPEQREQNSGWSIGGIGSPNFTGNDDPNVERWRTLVAKHFPPDKVEEALRIIGCESGGDPSAKNAFSNASGLFQHLPKYWAERSTAAGYPGPRNIFDPEVNIAVAAWLFNQTGDWRHWSCGSILGL